MSMRTGAKRGFRLADEDLRLVVDSIPHIVWVAAPDGATEYINRWGLEYGGVPADTDHDANWSDAVHPDDVEGSQLAWLAAATAGTAYENDFRLRRADGQYRWHRFRNSPLRDPRGQVRLWVGTGTDIHSQRELEDSLRAAQRGTADALARLETLLAATPVGIGFTDRDFRFVHVNETLAAMNGATVREQTGRTVQEVAPHLWPKVESIFERVLVDGRLVLEQQITGTSPADPDRSHSWLASFYPIISDGAIVGVGIAVVDITGWVEAEQFRSVVMDNMAEGLCTLDDSGLLRSINESGSRMLGWSPDELHGLSLLKAVNFQPTDGTAVGASVDSAQTGTATVVRADGATIPIAYSVVPLHMDRAVGGSILVFRDITEERERERREIESRHDQKLESLGRLSAGIAHEINTPIQFVGDNTRFLATSYQQMLDLLLVYRECLGITKVGPEGSAPQPWEQRLKRANDAEMVADIEYLAEEVPAAVAQSLEGIDRVASLVRAMKAFSYKDGGNTGYADLNDALTTTLTVARNEVKYVADVVLDLGEMPNVLCHVGDLNQVFLNLLVNAADAMEGRDGRGEIRVSSRADGAMAEIRIADNGSGIPPELQQAIFEPFFTTKQVGKGTGQGLALARSVLVDKHGGTITVRSAPDEGTEFVIRLPVDGKRGVKA